MANNTIVEAPRAPVDTQPGQRGVIPFRQATAERADMLTSQSGTISTSAQRVESVIEGSGLIYSVVLNLVVTCAGNSATVAFHEDAPWSAFDSVVLRDNNAELVNVDGYSLFIANLVNGEYRDDFLDASTNTSLYRLVTGSGGTGGSLAATLRVPVGINRRDLLGVLGNQDRAQMYFLRNDVAASTGIYTTPPTNAGSYAITRMYEWYSIPLAQAPTGQPQEQLPAHYGTIHTLTRMVSESAPAGGSTVQHPLRKLGNTIRWMGFILRQNGSRANAETNAPTKLAFRFGNETFFNEPYWYRRMLMFERYGFDFPNGVFVYENLHDFVPGAGYEAGDDYYHTALVQTGVLEATYPSGLGSTNNSLTIITDDLVMNTIR